MPREQAALSVLVVCEGNVCRSPAFGFALGRCLPTAHVESAGMRARPGAGLCSVVGSSILESDSESVDFVRGFRSRRMSAIDPAEFDLVLTATRELRADLATAHPSIRDRFFTYRELVHIVDQTVFPDDRSEISSSTGLANWLNLGRGLIVVPEPRRRMFRATVNDPFDIPDAHGGSAHRHRAVVGAALNAGTEAGAALGRVLGN